MGFGLHTFTVIHVVLSLVGIGAGFVVMYGLLAARRMDGWTALFLSTTVLTSVTGFGFPFERFEAPHWTGVISLAVLASAILARYPLRLAGAWRRVYVVGAVVSLYLNVFVGVVQAFEKVPALNALAPTQSEAPFLLTQLVVLALFAALGLIASVRFRVETVGATTREVAFQK